MASAFTELLATLSGVRGMYEKFVAGFDDKSFQAISARIRNTFGDDVSDFEASQIGLQMAKAVFAGDLFDFAEEGEVVGAAQIPITRGLRLPTGERARFNADVVVTVETQIGMDTVEVTKLIQITADRTLTPDELRNEALDETEELFREKGYGTPNMATAIVDVKWVFLTR